MLTPAAESEQPAVQIAEAMVEALRDGRLDAAEALWLELEPLVPDPQEFLVFPVVIAIQRGRVLDALRLLSTADERKVVELRALCLNLAGDPAWHGFAEEARASEDPQVRRAMSALLGEPLQA